MSPNKLFTYGTLCSGFNNPTALAFHKKSNLIGKAQIKGTLYLIKHSYPGLVQTEMDDAWIQGELWELKEPLAIIKNIDEYEGCDLNSPTPHEYARVVREIKLNDMLLDAWVYLYRLPVDQQQEIMSGDFKKLK